MKTKLRLILLAVALVPALCFGQTDDLENTNQKPTTRSDQKKELNTEGYLTKIGWNIKVGDTLTFGKGTLPNNYFAFAYESPTNWGNIMGAANNGYSTKTSSSDGYNKKYCTSDYRGRDIVVKKFKMLGNKKIGLKAIVVFGVGSNANYWLEVDNAIEEGEIKAPKEYASKIITSENADQQPKISNADELKKYKDLFDAGAITEAEYLAIKKKILGL